MVLVGFNRGCCHCYCLVAYCQKKVIHFTGPSKSRFAKLNFLLY